MNWLKQILTPPTLGDKEQKHIVGPLHAILLALPAASLACIVWVLISRGLPTNFDEQFTILSCVAIITMSTGLLLLLQRGRVKTVGAIVASAVWALPTLWSYSVGGIYPSTVAAYLLVIAIASLILGARAVLVFGLVSLLAIVGAFLAQVGGYMPRGETATSPSGLIMVMLILGVTILLLRSVVRSTSEALARARRGERELADTNHDLQREIKERKRAEAESKQLLTELERRNIQFQTAIEVSQSASTILDPQQLIDQAVTLIRKHFDFYYVGLFLTGENDEYAVLQSGTGEAGRQMLEEGHELEVGGPSMIGWCVAHGEARIALDVGEEPVRFDNPLLPETRSEMALPLRAHGQVVGALTVQSAEKAAFSQKDIGALQVMADQLAIAIENARLFEEAQQRAMQLETASEVARSATAILDVDQLLKETVHLIPDKFDFYHAGIFLLDEEGEYAVLHAASSEGGQRMLEKEHKLTVGETGIVGHSAATGEPRIALDVGEDAVFFNNPDLPETRSEIALPLVSRGKVIGVLDVQSKRAAAFTEKDVATLQTMADQLANAIENARLFEAANRHVAELRAVREASLQLTSTLELQPVLEAILGSAPKLLDINDAHIFLYDGKRLSFGAARWAGDAQKKPYAEPRPQGLTYTVARSGERIVVPDVQSDPLFQDKQWDDWNGAIIGLPLCIDDRVHGVMNLAFDEPHSFSESELRILELLADQAAIAIRNARLFEETQQRAAQSRALREVGLEITSELNLDALLHSIISWAVKLVDGTRGGLDLYQPEQEMLDFAIHAGYDTLPEKTTLRIGDGLAGKVWETGETIIVDNYAAWEGRADIWADHLGHFADIGVPVQWGDEFLGVLEVMDDPPRTFSQDDAELLELFANQAAIAIRNAQLYEETQQRALEQKTLREAALAMTTALNRDEVTDRILAQLQQVVPYDTASVQLLQDDQLKIVGGRGFPNLEGIVGISFDPEDEDNPNSQVVRTKEPFIVDNAPTVYEEFRREPHAQAGIRSWLGVPMLVGEQLIGLITLDKSEGEFYTKEHAQLAEAFAAQAAVAIENARLYERTQRHIGELTVLHNIDVAITSTLSLKKVLQRVYGQVSKTMDVTTFYIGLYDQEKKKLRLPIVVDQGEHLDPFTVKVQENGGFAGWVIRNEEPLWIDDWEEEQNTLPVKGISRGSPTRSLMVLPLACRDEVIGVISAQSYAPHAFDEGHRRLFSGIASQVAIAVENAQLFEETNRRLNETRLLQEVMQAAASTLDFDEVLERTVEALHRKLGIEYLYLSFALPDEEGTSLRLHPSQIGYRPQVNEMRIPMDESVGGRVYQTGEPQILPDVREAPLYFEGAPEVRSELTVPVKVDNHVAAVLNVESTEVDAFDEEDLRLFQAVAAQLGIVLESARLYQRLQKQKNELSQAYEDLKEMERLRSELVQNVSHELRTPFSLVHGYVELLLNEDLGPLLNTQRKALRVIRKRAKSLERLIRNLTTLDSISREKPTLAPVSIIDVVKNVLTEFHQRAEQADIIFRRKLPAELPPIQGDQEQIQLVFVHLIENAIKFSPDGGTVTIEAWSGERGDDWLNVSIEDEGIGIASEHLDRIFERFYQVDGSATRRFGGMGVGLAVAQEIVEAHEGTIEVESEPGEGSTFTVKLPTAN